MRLFDTPNEKGALEHLSKEPHRIRVERFLVYVPLLDLIHRLPGRNADALRTGNLPNQRQNIDLINQFMQTYRKAALLRLSQITNCLMAFFVRLCKPQMS